MGEEEIQEVEAPEEESPEVVLENAGLTGEQEEVVDPGQMEGKRKPDDEPGPDTPRFKKIYARLKGAEVTIENLRSKDSEKEAVMNEVRKHNQDLMNRIEALSNKAIEAVETVQKAVPEGDPQDIVYVKQAITDLETRKEEALENLKGKEVIQIDRELRKLERVLEGYEYHKSKLQAEKKQKPKDAPGREDPDIANFISEAKWFNKDPIMTGAAMEYDLYLSGTPEWKGKPLKDRLVKVKQDIESRFNAKESTAGPTRAKPPGAESGLGLQNHQGTSPLSGKTTKLSSAEMAVVQGLGITAEAYLKQKQFLGGAV